jgi:hypothetical protein
MRVLIVSPALGNNMMHDLSKIILFKNAFTLRTFPSGAQGHREHVVISKKNSLLLCRQNRWREQMKARSWAGRTKPFVTLIREEILEVSPHSLGKVLR